MSLTNQGAKAMLRGQSLVLRLMRMSTPPRTMTERFRSSAPGHGDQLRLATTMPAMVFATITVNSLADTAVASDGQCTLREAINNANTNSDTTGGDCTTGAGTDAISISVVGTITLASALPDLSSNLNVSGPGANQLTLQRSMAGGTPNFRILRVTAGNTVTVSGLTLSNGFLPGGGGGGIANEGGTLTVDGCVISGNSADSGGGILNSNNGFSSNSTLILTNSTVRNNTALVASNNGGAGIINVGFTAGFTTSATLSNCTISGNTISPTSTNSSGGGLFNVGVFGTATVSLTNCTISGNSAGNGGTGGGLVNNNVGAGGGATMTLLNDTITLNNVPGSGTGGGLRNTAGGTVNIKNTIVAQNSANTGPDVGGAAVASGGNNLIGDTTGSSGFGGSDLVNPSPGLGSLADNGGPTQTHALLTGSPALNAGNNTSAPATDQRGFARGGLHGTVDIGAYELQFIVTNTTDSGAGTLRQAITDANASPGADAIEFALVTPATINLSTTALPSLTSMTIRGPGAKLLTVNRSSATNFGIFITQFQSNSTVSISGLTISNGHANGTTGGGIFNNAGNTLTVTDCAISGNTVDAGPYSGGGVANSGGTLTIQNSTISGNTANAGGGISNTDSSTSDGVLTLINTTVSGNTANGGNPGQAGGILNFAGSGFSAILTLRNCTVANNASTATPGGITNFGFGASANKAFVNLKNTIIASATLPNFFNSSGTITSLGNNISSDATGNLTQPTDKASTDPRLVALADNGGPTRTHALMCGSPAIDMGDVSGGPLNDQRGQTRTGASNDGNGDNTSAADIGALETQKYVVLNTNDSGAGSLRQALLDNEAAGGGLVAFNIPGSGVQTIAPTSALPAITKTVNLDGYTQPGAARNTLAVGSNATLLVEIDGTGVAAGNGLVFGCGDSCVRGLVINGFNAAAINLNGAVASRNWINGNYLGVSANGSIALPNHRGVWIAGGVSNIIGTDGDGLSDFAERNVISGNTLNNGVGINVQLAAASNIIAGNYIGTNAAGTSALPNKYGIFFLEMSNGNTIGGTSTAARNVISGNQGVGIRLDSSNNTVIQGNYIGVAADGMTALGNQVGTDGPLTPGDGITIQASNGTTVGGTTTGIGNLIGFNSASGISLLASSLNNRILGNIIFANGALGIDLGANSITSNDSGDGDGGQNGAQNYPVLDSVSSTGTVNGSLDSLATNSAYPVRIEFFANTACDSSGNGEGEVYLGFTSVNGPGAFTANLTLVSGKNYITATATDNNGNTSEFSACRLVNSVPTISGATLSAQQGSPAMGQQIATIGDADQAANTLNVMVTPLTGTGVTVGTPSIDGSGNVTASIQAGCTATTSTFQVKVTDSVGEMATATLTVNVASDAKPVLSYNDANVLIGGSTLINPVSSPSDNGSVMSISVQNTGTYTGGILVDNSTGVITISGATPPGMHSITIRATDNCGLYTDAQFTLTVGCPTVLTVNDLGDTADSVAGDGLCNDGTGKCTLRAALQEANALTALACSPLTIDLSGVLGTIQLGTALPAINHPNLTITGPGANQLDIHRNAATLFRIFTVNSGKTVAISGLTISNGNVIGMDGGGVYSSGYLTLTNCALTGNQSDGEGGAVYSTSTGTLNLMGCTLTGNTANKGGGLSAGQVASLLIEVTNTTIYGNTAANGGGISLDDASATLNLLNVTLAGNTATANGGGIAQTAGTINFKNTIVAGNSAPVGTDISGMVVSQNFNLIGATGGAIISGTTGNNITGVPALLAPLGNYGGATNTLALLPGSPALNAGTNTGAPASDQRGITRPQLGVTDIGAFESRGFTLAIAGGNNQITPPTTMFPNPLLVSVTSSFGEPVAGGVVTFTAPGSGPSATLAGNPATLNGSGQASVTATANNQQGTYQVTAATNGANSVNFTLTNQCPTITLAALPTATAGTPYNQTLTASPAGGNYTFALAGGSTLPPGFASLAANGQLMGTPMQTGTFSFNVVVTGFGSVCSNTVPVTLVVVCPTVLLAPATLPGGVQGAAYNQTFSAAPVGTAYSYAVTVNTLPPGLTLNNLTGALTGTPTASGNYTFGITVTGWGGCARTQSYNLLILGTCGTITVNPASLPAGTLGVAYPATSISATGGTAPHTFSVTQGALPVGLMLNSTTGAITGTPMTAGVFSFRITATSVGGCTGSRQYTLIVSCSPLTFNPAGLPSGTKGMAYTQQITVTPGSGYAFSLLTGSLPPGFTLSSGGMLSGITNQTGTFNFTVKAVSGSCQATKAYSLTLTAPPVSVALTQLADYDGDGKGDFALWSETGAWSLLLSSNGAQRQAQSQNWGAKGDLTLLGDYDGDGRTDLTVFRPANGSWDVRYSSDGSTLSKTWGLSSDVPVPGDYDGDGKTDIAVFRPSEGNWYILYSGRSADQQVEVLAWGAGYAPYFDVATPGDYDGDGKTDLAVFRRGTGNWWVKYSGSNQVLTKQWGLGTDVPVAADYDGDGKTDLAVFRAGNWYIWRSTVQSAQVETWGTSTAPHFDQATPSDYDGDGLADVAIWRAGEQSWYVNCSLNGLQITRAPGHLGYRPVNSR